MAALGLMLSFQYDTVLCEIGKPAETDAGVSVGAKERFRRRRTKP